MISRDDFHPLSDFQRNTPEYLQRLKKTRRPQVLTVDGKAELVVQDADAYQEVLEQLDRAEAIIGIQRGLESMARGKGRDAFEVLREIREKVLADRDS